MDLKLFYQKIREAESKIADAFPVVVSQETGDGGKEGKFTETTRAIAAKAIAEGTARLANAEEAKAFREQQAEANRVVQELAAAARVHFTVVPTSELNKMKGGPRSAKD